MSLRKEDCEFKANLVYTARLTQKKKKKEKEEAEIRRIVVQSQPRQIVCETLS
jgi:predicted GNAT family N-acyltransferase